MAQPHASTSTNSDKAKDKQQALQLHIALPCELSEQLDSSQPEYTNLRQYAKLFLGDGVLQACDNIIDLFNKLDSRDIISLGNYTHLVEILERAGLMKLSDLVKRREKEIKDLGSPKVEQSKSESSAGLTVVEERCAIHWLPDPPDSRTQRLERLKGPRLRHLEEESESWQTTCKANLHVFVNTKCYREAHERLHMEDCLVLLACPGEGKSFILQQISVDLAEEGYLTICLNNPGEIASKFVRDKKILFICDNVFGGPYYVQSKVDDWVNGQFPTNSNVKFLFTSRKLIWAECKSTATSLTLFKSTLDVSSKRLPPAEKEQMLRNHMDEKHVISDDMIDRISKMDTVAFPVSCKRFSLSDMTNQSDICRMFEHPFQFIRELIVQLQERCANHQDLEKWKFSTLVLVMLNDGLKDDQLNPSSFPNESCDKFRKTLDAVLPGLREAALNKIKDNANKLCETYLTKEHGCYKFDHDSVFEAVVSVYGEIYPEHILQFCDPALVVSVCRSENYADTTNACVVKLSANYYSTFVEILSNEASSGRWYVFGNPCVRDDAIQQAWIEHLQTSPDEPQSYSINRYGNILYHAAETEAFKLLVYLFEHVKHEYLQTCFSSYRYHPFVGLATCGHVLYVERSVKQLPGNRRRVAGDVENCIVTSKFLQYGIPQNSLDEGLVAASRRGHVDVVSLLLNHGMSTHVLGKGLAAAVAFSHTELIHLYLRHGVPEDELSYGFERACLNEDARVVEVFLQYEIRKDVLCKGLVLACLNQLPRVVHLLIQRDIPVASGFELSCSMGILSIIEIFLDHGLSTGVVSKGLIEASKAGQLAVAQRLLEYNIPEDAINESFIKASWNGHVGMADMFLQRNILPDIVDNGLVEACRAGCEGVVQLLSKHEFPPDTLKKGLINASRGGYVNIVNKLLQRNFPGNAIGKALTEAAQAGNADVVDLLLKQDVPTDVLGDGLTKAAWGGHVGVVELLSAYNVPLDSFSDALAEASRKGQVEVIQLLLQKDFEVDDLDEGLIKASEGGHVQTVELLLTHKVSISGVGEGLVRASRGGHLEVAKLLLLQAIPPDKMAEGLEGAADQQHVEMVHTYLNQNPKKKQ